MTAAATAPRIQVEQIGDEREPVVMIDDFVADPYALVEDAAARPFEQVGEYYPGIRAPTPASYAEAIVPLIAPVLREVFGCRQAFRFTRSLYSLATTPAGQLTPVQRIPHVDGVVPGMIAILHYLCDHGGGTSFYRHRTTGFETLNAAREHAYFDALEADFARASMPEPDYIRGDTPIFAHIGGSPAVFNRAIIYRGALLHCAAIAPGARLSRDVRIGRLTIASFLVAQ